MDRARYVVDPDDPRAPSQEIWDRLTEEERAQVLASLPSEIPRAQPPEGDFHRLPKASALSALDEYYRRMRRSVYLASELPVYYPDERMFAPDLFAVLDVANHARDHWTVSHEKRGLDFVLEVHVAGHRKKDLETNVVRYARVGIPEYFVFEPLRRRLRCWRLPTVEARTYDTMLPQQGRWPSSVLGLELGLEAGKLRFYAGSGPLPDAHELIAQLSSMVDESVRSAEEEARRAEEEARRAEEEARRAEGEARRAEGETRRAEEEARRAEEEARRADALGQRIERLTARLRELGVDPDEIE